MLRGDPAASAAGVRSRQVRILPRQTVVRGARIVQVVRNREGYG